MTYEDYLVSRRHGAGPVKRHVPATVAKEVAASQVLADWLHKNAGDITLVTDGHDAKLAIDQLKAQGEVIGIDIETAKAPVHKDHPLAGLNPLVSSIRLVQLFNGRDTGVIIVDCQRAGHHWLGRLHGARYAAHNAQFECDHFWRHVKQELDIECTMLAGRVFDGELKKLSDYANEYLGLKMSKALQVSDWSRADLLDEQLKYAGADAVVAKMLWQKFDVLFADSDDKYLKAYQLLKSLVYPVIRQAGIGFDAQAHAQVVATWRREEAQAREQLVGLGLHDPASVKQKQQWLEDSLSMEDLQYWVSTPAGGLSTAAVTLEQALHVPGAAPLAKWSRASSRLANFGPELARKVINAHLYPDYRIASGVTGRFGCINPNIQNQPRVGFKHLYRADTGYKFVTGDLNQIEFRVAGILSQDQAILEAYENGRDLHREVAAQRAGKDPEQVTREERQAAKAINFGLIFGAGAQTLRKQAANSYGVDMSIEEAQEAKAFFHAKYEGLTRWQQEVVQDANAFGYSQSPYCQLTRHYDDRVYTHAMNYPVQSGAWEVLALAIIYIDARLPCDGSIRISHHVYDELCLVARDNAVTAAALLLKDGFLHGFTTVFPTGTTRGLIKVGAGQTWEAAAQNEIPQASL